MVPWLCLKNNSTKIFSHRWHIRATSRPSRSSQETIFSNRWQFLTFPWHPPDHRKNKNQRLLASTVTPTDLSERLPIVEHRQRTICNFRTVEFRDSRKESPALPSTLPHFCCASPGTSKEEPQQPPACLPGLHHCTFPGRHRETVHWGQPSACQLCAIGTFYNWLQVSLGKSAFAGTYQATLLGRAIDTNRHNQQLLGLIKGLSTGVSQAAKLNQQLLGLIEHCSMRSPPQVPAAHIASSHGQLAASSKHQGTFSNGFHQYLAHVNMCYFAFYF